MCPTTTTTTTKIQGTGAIQDSLLESIKADQNLEFVVGVLEVGDNNKILSDSAVSIMNNAKSQLNRSVAVLLLSKDDTSKKPKTIVVAQSNLLPRRERDPEKQLQQRPPLWSCW